MILRNIAIIIFTILTLLTIGDSFILFAEEKPTEVVNKKNETKNEVTENKTPEEPNLPTAPELDVDVPLGDVTMEFPGQESREALMSRSDAEKISIDFPDEEVRTIIRNVADLYDLNVVIPETLVGSTSLKLRNVTWRQVLDVILEPIGYTYIEDRNIIKIKSTQELLQEPTDTRVFVINFADATEIQESIAPLIDSGIGGRIQVDSRSNSLVITERPSRMDNIQEIIDRLDRPTAQVLIESKFIEVTNRDTKNIGVNWRSLNSYGLNGGPFERSYTKRSGSTRSSTDDNTNSDGNTVTKTVTDTFDLTGDDKVQFKDETESVNAVQNVLTKASSLIFNSTQGRADSAVFSADAFGVVLSALKSFSEVELISNPTIVTVNNTQAQINIGEEFPVPAYTYNEERGTFEVSGFDFKPIGIILKVTPQVNSAGFITLKINPEISTRTGTVSFGGEANASIPIIATRKTINTVTIKDGYTLAIGGLIEKTTENNKTRVPFFENLPGIGKLFRSKSESENRRNLIIFITAKTLNPDGSTYKDIFSPDVLNDMNIDANEIPGYDIPAEDLEMYEKIQAARDNVSQLKIRSKMKAQLEGLKIKGQNTDFDIEDTGKPVKKEKVNW